MKVSTEQQIMYQSNHQQEVNQQQQRQPSPGVIIGGKDSFIERKMSQEHHHHQQQMDGHFGGDGGHIHHQENLMSHHLHRMEFNGSGSDSHGSQSSNTSSLEYNSRQERDGGHQDRSLDGHRALDIAYPMMNLEEFIHQQTAGFSDPDSGSDRSGHSEYGRDYETKPNHGVIHHKGSKQDHGDFSPSDLALATSPNSQYHFDPSNVTFNSDELKPQPIISKSRKTLVPEGMKDNRYWARRAKNNVAAKRSREARRLKENQIILRASYLEKENQSLKMSVERLTKENELLKRQQNYTN